MEISPRDETIAINRIWRYGVRTTFGNHPGKDEPMPDKVSIFGHDH